MEAILPHESLIILVTETLCCAKMAAKENLY